MSAAFVFAALAVFLHSFPLPFSEDENHPVFEKIPCEKDNAKLVFVSDTQSPIPVEKIFLAENGNLRARQMIFEKIVSEKPAAVFHLGDLTAYAYAPQAWQPLDNFATKLAKNNIGFYPVFGNHEYLLFSEKGRENFTARFPYASEIGYSVKCGSVTVILLNSNFSKLSNAQIDEQQKRYEKFIAEAEKDSVTKIIIVATHYPPFTNSKVIAPNKGVQRLFLPAFYKATKAKLFLSGHAHVFEHFKENGKDFLVIGGGGGLLQPVYTGEDERFKDLFDDKSPKRMFHFIEMKFNDAGKLEITVKAVRKDFAGFEDKYRLEIAP